MKKLLIPSFAALAVTAVEIEILYLIDKGLLFDKYVSVVVLLAIINIVNGYLAVDALIENHKNEYKKVNQQWKFVEYPTGLINPKTGKEWVLSPYYKESGNKYFTHEEALAIAERFPGWRLCDDEFHNALYKAVWDKETNSWRKDVNGSGMNGFEYLTEKLGYELGGFRASGTLYGVGNLGYSWSSSIPAGSSNAHGLGFGNSWLNPQGNDHRAYGFQVRLIKE